MITSWPGRYGNASRGPGLGLVTFLWLSHSPRVGAFRPPHHHHHAVDYNTPSSAHHPPRHDLGKHRLHLLSPNTPSTTFDASDQSLALWVFSFASSHIGMSAVRTAIISTLGETADALKLVGNADWTLPPWWPGDSSGNEIFPDNLTAGRQAYRAIYTAVSFVTLGSAFAAYVNSSKVSIGGNASVAEPNSMLLYNACLFSAALSFGAAMASLFNASPLGLMPSFDSASHKGDDGKVAAGNATTIAGLRRDDALKFTTRGLTRITRHPLILPVVPWGFATAYLAGGRTCDYLLFDGLALYAVAGCFAQDLRVLREEGSVGTVFRTESPPSNDDGGEDGERSRLRGFFEETSFVPFKAVLDGRQNIHDIAKEFPWIQLIAGTVLGVSIEEKILQLLNEVSLQ